MNTCYPHSDDLNYGVIWRNSGNKNPVNLGSYFAPTQIPSDVRALFDRHVKPKPNLNVSKLAFFVWLL